MSREMKALIESGPTDTPVFNTEKVLFLQIDTSICGMKPRKKKIPLCLMVENSSLLGDNKLKNSKFITDLQVKVSKEEREMFVTQKEINSEAFRRSLFRSSNEEAEAKKEAIIRVSISTASSGDMLNSSSLFSKLNSLKGKDGQRFSVLQKSNFGPMASGS